MVPHDSTSAHQVPCVHTDMTLYLLSMVTKTGPYPQGAWSPLGEQTTQQAATTRHENAGRGEGQECQDMVEFSGIRSGLWEEVALGLGNSKPVRVEGRQAPLTQGPVSHRTALNVAVT